MKRKSVLIAGLIVAGGFLYSSTAALPTVAASSCIVQAQGTAGTTGASGQFILGREHTIAAKFVVQGDDCSESLALSVRKMGENYDYSHTTATFGSGAHVLSAKLPTCEYEAVLSIAGKRVSTYNGGAQPCSSVQPLTTVASAIHMLPQTGVSNVPLFSAGVIAILTGLGMYAWGWWQDRKKHKK